MHTIDRGSSPQADAAASAGAAIYTKRLLSTYDLFVLGLSLRFIWRCPSTRIVELYQSCASDNHLDVGVGTGYFLDHCRFPSPRPRIALVDLNANSLAYTARRLARYAPETHLADVLQPLGFQGAGFDSIGLNFLLHCLPGTMPTKAAVFDNLRPYLNPGGVVFGSTVLGQGVDSTLPARALMRAYNAKRIFSNAADSFSDLERVLSERFPKHSLERVGSVALFSARAGPPAEPAAD